MNLQYCHKCVFLIELVIFKEKYVMHLYAMEFDLWHTFKITIIYNPVNYDQARKLNYQYLKRSVILIYNVVDIKERKTSTLTSSRSWRSCTRSGPANITTWPTAFPSFIQAEVTNVYIRLVSHNQIITC